MDSRFHQGPAEKHQLEDLDTELVRRATRGETMAFQSLVKRHLKYLFSLAQSLVGNSADAEDVLQESLTGAYRGLSKFKGQAPVKLWLSGIVARQAARFHQRRKSRRMVSLEDMPETSDAASAAPGALSVDRRLDIQAFLEKLSDQHRQVIILRELHGLSYLEIAQALGVPQGTVESRLFRAREELAILLKEYSRP